MAFSSRVGAHLRAGYLAAGWREKVGRRRSGYVDAAGSAMNQTRENHETSLPTRNGANAITNSGRTRRDFTPLRAAPAARCRRPRRAACYSFCAVEAA
jgi:hypothetical protein